MARILSLFYSHTLSDGQRRRRTLSGRQSSESSGTETVDGGGDSSGEIVSLVSGVHIHSGSGLTSPSPPRRKRHRSLTQPSPNDTAAAAAVQSPRRKRIRTQSLSLCTQSSDEGHPHSPPSSISQKETTVRFVEHAPDVVMSPSCPVPSISSTTPTLPSTMASDCAIDQSHRSPVNILDSVCVDQGSFTLIKSINLFD